MNKQLIIALDVDSIDKAKHLVDALFPSVDIFKVGSQLFVNSGPAVIDYINKKKKKVFLDLKFYDIPNTVEKACIEAARHRVFMLTLHASGGFDMMSKAQTAVRKMKKSPLLVGVTVLTSKEDKNAKTTVLELAKLSQEAGLNGVVCSPKETWLVKKVCGAKFIVVNPGIRPVWAAVGDQRRFTTPKEAIQSGADFIVVGRPVTEAEDPAEAAKKIMEEI